MRFSQGFIYKCLLADQNAPRSYGSVKLMLGAQGEKERKREAIILSMHRHFLLLFHPLEAQEVHPQTIWYLEVRCESWGNARAQQYPQGPERPSPRLLSPAFHGTVSFTSFLITLLPVRLLPGLKHLCCITGQKTIPTLRQANCISFVSLAQLQKSHWNQSAMQPLIACYWEAGWRYWGHPRKSYLKAFLSRFECTQLRLNWVTIIISLLWCAVSP